MPQMRQLSPPFKEVLYMPQRRQLSPLPKEVVYIMSLLRQFSPLLKRWYILMPQMRQLSPPFKEVLIHASNKEAYSLLGLYIFLINQ